MFPTWFQPAQNSLLHELHLLLLDPQLRLPDERGLFLRQRRLQLLLVVSAPPRTASSALSPAAASGAAGAVAADLFLLSLLAEDLHLVGGAEEVLAAGASRLGSRLL